MANNLKVCDGDWGKGEIFLVKDAAASHAAAAQIWRAKHPTALEAGQVAFQGTRARACTRR